eukprot:310673-Amphidinium_carterae.1
MGSGSAIFDCAHHSAAWVPSCLLVELLTEPMLHTLHGWKVLLHLLHSTQVPIPCNQPVEHGLHALCARLLLAS